MNYSLEKILEEIEIELDLEEEENIKLFSENFNLSLIFNEEDSSESKGIFDNVKDKAADASKYVKDKAADASKYAKDKAGEASKYVKDKAGDIASGVEKTLNNVLNGIDGYLQKGLNGIDNTLKNMAEYIQGNEKIQTVEDIVFQADKILDVPARVIATGQKLDFVINGTRAAVNQAFGRISKNAKQAKATAAKGLGLFKRGNQQGAEEAASICQKIINGIGQAFKSIASWFSNLWKGIKASVPGKDNAK